MYSVIQNGTVQWMVFPRKTEDIKCFINRNKLTKSSSGGKKRVRAKYQVHYTLLESAKYFAKICLAVQSAPD